MKRTAKIAGIIVAAGYSSRMGRLKPLLPLGGKTALEMAADSLRQGGIDDILVVGGHSFSQLLPVLEKISVDVVYNPLYDQGMFSSVVAGLKALLAKPAQYEAFFLLPGDIPLIRPKTIEALLKERRKTGAPLIQPVFNKQKGHPPLIGEKCFASILKEDALDGLRGILNSFAAESKTVEVIDQGILLDMDTPDDYEKLVQFFVKREIPTAEECLAILRKYQSNPNVFKHGQKVGEVGASIAKLLNTEAGFNLNLDLITAGGFVHDLAKGKPNHAERGASLLAAWGFSLLAPIIASHMDFKFTAADVIDEVAAVFLADKLVQGEKLVSIAARFERAQEKFSSQPKIAALISERRQTAETIFEQLTNLVGINRLQEVLQGG